jgi:four helix bundle protein
MGDFKDLKVWQRAQAVTLTVYCLTRTFPHSERSGLASQMHRAACSITANIAESRGRYGNGDQLRLLRFAQGSARELECHTLTARDVGLLLVEPANDLLAAVAEVERMLSGLIRRSASPRPRHSAT